MKVMELQDTPLQKMQAALLGWFSAHARDFPWRTASNAFHVLLSEKLLQQTAAGSAVVTAFEALRMQYPEPHLLAAAQPAIVEDIIRPLGFRYRAKELIAMSNELVERHSGEIPTERHELLALTGVGEYAARAVLSFAYRQDVAIVDTNVARWLSRMLDLHGPLPANPARSRRFLSMATALIPTGHSRHFNFAILDLCAIVCKPAKPQCDACPVREWCAYGGGRVLLSGEVEGKV